MSSTSLYALLGSGWREFQTSSLKWVRPVILAVPIYFLADWLCLRRHRARLHAKLFRVRLSKNWACKNSSMIANRNKSKFWDVLRKTMFSIDLGKIAEVLHLYVGGHMNNCTASNHMFRRCCDDFCPHGLTRPHNRKKRQLKLCKMDGISRILWEFRDDWKE